MVNVGGGSSGVPFNVGAVGVPLSMVLFHLFSLTKVFYILFMYIFFMFILVELITCNEFHKVKVN